MPIKSKPRTAFHKLQKAVTVEVKNLQNQVAETVNPLKARVDKLQPLEDAGSGTLEALKIFGKEAFKEELTILPKVAPNYLIPQNTLQSESIVDTLADNAKTEIEKKARLFQKLKPLADLAYPTLYSLRRVKQYYLVGDVKELGEWDSENGVKLSYFRGSVWTTNITLKANGTIKYKIILKDEQNAITWETGDDQFFVVPQPKQTKTIARKVTFGAGKDDINININVTGK